MIIHQFKTQIILGYYQFLGIKFDILNLQATKLFILTSATKGVGYHLHRFSVRFKILYRVIQPLI